MDGNSAHAFAAFVRAETPTLLRTAYLLTGSAPAAEELVQDTLVRLYPKWSRVTAADAPVAYVRRSLVNVFLNGRRRHAATDISMDVVPERSDRFDVAEGVADRDLAWRLLDSLPDRQRAALVLRYFHDAPDEQIAESLGCRVGTVRSLISRGLAALRRDAADDPACSSQRRYA